MSPRVPRAPHAERHRSERIGWLRAAVLGANDGIVSTASLLVGVAAAEASRSGILVAGVAGLVAGAMSMAAGEYVSVSSQADTERADLVRERRELDTMPGAEREELRADLREARPRARARRPGRRPAHGEGRPGRARPGRARHLGGAHGPPHPGRAASAATFAVGAALPLVTAAVLPPSGIVPGVSTVSLACLALLGGLAAGAGGAPIGRGVLRVTFWGAFAMAVTAAIGRLFGAVV